MIRTHFYYTTIKHPEVEILCAVKHCMKPNMTKVWKQLTKGQDEGKFNSIKWSREDINLNN